MESLEKWVRVGLVIIMVLNIILHSIGLYFLTILQRKHSDGQNLFVANLSVVEISLNVFSLLVLFLQVLPQSSGVVKAQDYIYIMDHTILNFTFYMSNMYLTINKLLEIFLNLKYPSYINARSAKYILFSTWFVGCIVFTAVIIPFELTNFDYEKFDMYFFLLLDFGVLIVNTSCYGYIFRKFVQTRRHPSLRRKNTTVSILHIYRHSNFYICVMLIAVFTLFIVIPDLLLECITIYHHNDNVEALMYAVAFLYATSYTLHAAIYIFIQPKIRRLLCLKLRSYMSTSDETIHLSSQSPPRRSARDMVSIEFGIERITTGV